MGRAVELVCRPNGPVVVRGAGILSHRHALLVYGVLRGWYAVMSLSLYGSTAGRMTLLHAPRVVRGEVIMIGFAIIHVIWRTWKPGSGIRIRGDMIRIRSRFPSILALVVLAASCGSSDSVSTASTALDTGSQQSFAEGSAVDDSPTNGEDVYADAADDAAADDAVADDAVVDDAVSDDMSADAAAGDDAGDDAGDAAAGDDAAGENAGDDVEADAAAVADDAVVDDAVSDDAAAVSSGEDSTEDDYPSNGHCR